MATKVSVITNPGNRISINNQLGTTTATSLSQLVDVDITTRANNNVLVYEDSSGNFVSKVMPIIDGGEY